MCGIWGVLVAGEDPQRFAEMHRRLSHRGPDAEGVLQVNGNILGHRRLSIIDLSAAASQPMWDVQQTVCIVFNGEIYNYRELRAVCVAAGLSFRTSSDTEVILNLFLLEGEMSFRRLNGMFAFALYDSRSSETFLVRDRVGIKPLYYGAVPGGIIFASELGAMLATGAFPLELDPTAVGAYLQFDFVPSPLSIIRGIRKLTGGTLLHVDRIGRSEVRSFLPPETLAERSRRSDASDLAEFDRVIHDVVSRQLVADVPVGVFLSGGIDSSIIARVATDLVGKIATFSIAFDDPTFDERRYFERVATSVGSNHHSEVLSARHMMDLLPRAASIVTEPLADGSIFPTYLLSRLARRHVTVALSGDGADELFAGYPTHQLWRIGNLVARIPAAARTRLRSWVRRFAPVSYGNMSAGFRVQKFLEGVDRDPLVQNQRWLGSFQPEEVPLFLRDGRSLSLEGLLQEARSGGAADLESVLRADRRFYLQDGVLVKVDRCSMSHSLEVRVPFLDNEMLEFASNLPSNRKIRRGQSKWLLRRWVEQRLPVEIARRTKKGFGAPLGRWFRGELRDFVRQNLSTAEIERDGILRPEPVQRLLEDHDRGVADERKRIFNLLMLKLWYDDVRAIAARGGQR